MTIGLLFFSSDIDDNSQRCLHDWEVSVTDDSSISKLFFLDDYPKLLEDSSMKFWGAAFIGTKSGQILLVDLRTWSVYQRMNITESPEPKNFDYRIDLTSRIVVAMNGNQCFVVQIEHDQSKISSGGAAANSNQVDINLLNTSNPDIINGNIFSCLSKPTAGQRPNQKSTPTKQGGSSSTSASSLKGLPRIVRTTRLDFHNPIYSFVIKHKSDDELEMFTISAYSLERYIINLNVINSEAVEDIPISASLGEESRPSANTPHELKRFLQQFDGSLRISSSGTAPNNTPNSSDINSMNTSAATTVTPLKQEMDLFNLMNASVSYQNSNQQTAPVGPISAPSIPVSNAASNNLNVNNSNAGAKKEVAHMVDVSQMDRMVEALFTRLNTSFSQGLDEFLNDVKCEVNDLKLKLNGLCRDVRQLRQQLQDTRQK